MPATATKTPITIPAIAPDDSPPPPPTMEKIQESRDQSNLLYIIVTVIHFNVYKNLKKKKKTKTTRGNYMKLRCTYKTGDFFKYTFLETKIL